MPNPALILLLHEHFNTSMKRPVLIRLFTLRMLTTGPRTINMPPWPKKAKKTNRTQSGWAASGPGVEDSYPVWGSSAWAEPNSCWASSGSAQANSNAAWGDSTISWTASNVAWGDSHPGWDDSGPKWVSTSKSDWDIPNEEEVAQKLAEVDLSSQNRVEEEYRKNIEREKLQEKFVDWPWKNAPEQLLTLV